MRTEAEQDLHSSPSSALNSLVTSPRGGVIRCAQSLTLQESVSPLPWLSPHPELLYSQPSTLVPPRHPPSYKFTNATEAHRRHLEASE